jgi:hypothetical protein
MKHSHVHQIRMQFPSQVQQILCLLLWLKMSQWVLIPTFSPAT